MTRNPLRWADAETAAAWYDVRELAPRLSGLIYCAPMPDGPLSTLLEWSEAVASDDGAAFGLDRLRAVMPALVRGFVSSHTYAYSRQSGGIDLYDAGCGRVVARVMANTAQIAMALHADDGRALVEASRSELAAALGQIHALMTGR